MKPPFLPTRPNETYEEYEQRLARSLGLTHSLSALNKAIGNLIPNRPLLSGKVNSPRPASASVPAPVVSEKAKLEQMFAGKTTAERMALVRANRARLRDYLRNGDQGSVGNSSKYVTRSTSGGKVIHRSLKQINS